MTVKKEFNPKRCLRRVERVIDTGKCDFLLIKVLNSCEYDLHIILNHETKLPPLLKSKALLVPYSGSCDITPSSIKLLTFNKSGLHCIMYCTMCLHRNFIFEWKA